MDKVEQRSLVLSIKISIGRVIEVLSRVSLPLVGENVDMAVSTFSSINRERKMSTLQIVTVNGKPGVYSWADGFKTRREESLERQALKSEEDLLQVCLWLENHGQKEEAIALLERVLH